MRRAEREPFSILLFHRANILRVEIPFVSRRKSTAPFGHGSVKLAEAVIIFLSVVAARAEIIDRIAVSVGNSVITAADVVREIRVTAFLNGSKLDFSAATKHATAERLVEQNLIRRELELTRFSVPEAAAAAPAFLEFRKTQFPNDEEFQRALNDAGITEQDLKDELLWQLTFLSFVDVRFRPGVQLTEKEIGDYFEKVVRPIAQAAHPGETVSLEDYRDKIDETLTGKRADEQVDLWLQETRKRTDIVFHEEALQ
jgi:hypothetical protein